MPNIASLRRADILVEYEGLISEFTSSWVETGGVSRVRVACHHHNSTAPTLEVREAVAGTNDGAYPVRVTSPSFTSGYAFAEVDLVGRAFKLSVSSNGGNDGPVQLIVRSV